MSQKYSVIATKKRMAVLMPQNVIPELIVDAIAFDLWEMMEETSYLQEGKAMKKWRS